MCPTTAKRRWEYCRRQLTVWGPPKTPLQARVSSHPQKHTHTPTGMHNAPTGTSIPTYPVRLLLSSLQLLCGASLTCLTGKWLVGSLKGPNWGRGKED